MTELLVSYYYLREYRMSLYLEYVAEIETRKNDLGLAPKPIDSADLIAEIIEQIKDKENELSLIHI